MIVPFLSLLVFTGCNDLLDVDSDRVITKDEYQLDAANDSLYSMFGVFSKLQKLADSYVLTGELRADLMDATDKADVYLKELSGLNYSADNPYVNNIKDYYAVINNCNYIVEMVDTTTVKGGVLVMRRLTAAAKSIRAWTYMQVALNFGRAKYYENPILTLADAEKVEKTAPLLSIEELAPYLIADLGPYKDENPLWLGSVYSASLRNSFFPVRFVLGDLYLWSGQYEKAATEYHDLMVKEELPLLNYYRIYWGTAGNAFNGYVNTSNWPSQYAASSLESITNIVASNEHGTVFRLDSINRNYMLKPTDVAKSNWDSQRYYVSNMLDTVGDLRGLVAYYKYAFTSEQEIFEEPVLLKYVYLNPKTNNEKTNRQVSVYRTPLLYLRYAEAVNRLGKHHMALAVLKHGLSPINMANPNIIPTWEVGETVPNYLDFRDAVFTSNVGLRQRSLGNPQLDPQFVIPDKATLDAMGTDSVTYMEDLIVKELALETFFDGNRFHDLMRVAMRRNDNSFLANRVAAKHKGNEEAVKAKLMDRKNWYLKYY